MKKGFYFCVFLILILIVGVVIPTVIVPVVNKEDPPTANGEELEVGGGENDDVLQDDEINIPPQIEDDEETDSSEPSQPPQELEEVKVAFQNAWQAFKYAETKNSELKSYVVLNQGATAKTTILGVPVNVKASVNRKIYNNIEDIYVVTDVKSDLDIGSLGIDKTMYEGFNACTVFETDEDLVQDADGWAMSLEDYVALNGITLYQIPFKINKETATVLGGLVSNPKNSYYEIKMQLNEKAWKNSYEKALKNTIQVEDTPKIESVILTIRIDKKYGTFQSIESEEKFTFDYPYGGVKYKLSATGKTTMRFNYQADISKKVKELKLKVYP